MTENAYYSNQTATPVRKFQRSRDDRVVAGVCGGAAKFFGVDANLLRVILVVAAILGVGTGILVYLACWLLVPEEV
jgi:phage shock protein PspC (stress-responsive transcriptional regulator)